MTVATPPPRTRSVMASDPTKQPDGDAKHREASEAKDEVKKIGHAMTPP